MKKEELNQLKRALRSPWQRYCDFVEGMSAGERLLLVGVLLILFSIWLIWDVTH